LAWVDGRVWFLMVREGMSMLVYLVLVLVLIRHHGINSVGYAALSTSVVEFLIFVPLCVTRVRSVAKVPDNQPTNEASN
jgi:O-antigen/teichoic acid export membrane protein